MESNFTVLDWWIVGVYLAATVGVGLYANRYIRDMADYIVAGRSLQSFISVATMLGSEIGLVTVVYAGQKGFTGGFAAFHIGLAGGLVCLLIGLSGLIVVPLRRAGVMTIPEFYGQRFGQGVRVLGAVILAAAGILNMGAFLRAGAVFLTSLTGLEDPAAVKIVMTVLLALVLGYTILGGMISVVITDYAQFVVLAFGLIATCVLAVVKLGWNDIVNSVGEVLGNSGFDPLDVGGFGVSYVVWMFITFGLVSCAVWPTAVMRACAARDEQVVRRLYAWSSIGFMTRLIIPQFLGICALAYFWQKLGPDSQFFTAAGRVVDAPDVTLEAMPLFLSQILPVGMIGLIGAGMLAAFMSTHDSYLLCWASVIVEDVITPIAARMGTPVTVKTRLLIARVLIFLIGVFLLIWSLWYPMGQDMLDYMAVSGGIYATGALSLLLFGLYWPRASRAGAYAALIVGGLSVIGLTPVRDALGLTEEKLGFELTGAQVGLFCTAAALAVMVLVSFCIPDRRASGEHSP